MEQRELERLHNYAISRLDKIRQKADEKALRKINNGNQPKKSKIASLRATDEFRIAREELLREMDTNNLSELINSEDYGCLDCLYTTKEYKDYCRKHEFPEEREARLKKEEEEKRIKEAMLKAFDDYLDTKECEEIVEKKCKKIAEECAGEIRNYLLNLNNLEDEVWSSNNYYDFYYDDEEDNFDEDDDDDEYDDEYEENGSTTTITDYIDRNSYNGKLSGDFIENFLDEEDCESDICQSIIDAFNTAFIKDGFNVAIIRDEAAELIYDNIAFDAYYETLNLIADFFPESELTYYLNKNSKIKKLSAEAEVRKQKIIKINEKREAERKRKQEEKERKNRETEQKILERIPDRYIDMYPEARKLNRKFVLHIGDTNSGKTYDAIKALEKADNGTYLAPLRLLAYEQYEKMNADGIKCSMITGEEKIETEDATHIASTIEMANLHIHYAVAVIDEAQMVADDARGGAWTAAILGICADEIHICMSENAESLVKRMIEECGESYTTVRHQRKTPLVMEEKSFSYPNDVKSGDALIVFSRRNVHAVAAELTEYGHHCSVIYGALPYDARHKQAELFANGENDVVVATDAIGMGMNLPIKRIVFLEQKKYDGNSMRWLKSYEVKQIAGRAGRLGMYNEGYVASFENKKFIKDQLNNNDTALSKAVIQFPEILLRINEPLSVILQRWIHVEVQEGYTKAITNRELKLCKEMEKYTNDKQLIYSFITIPFDEENDTLHSIWHAMYANTIINTPFPVRKYIPRAYGTLDEMEQAFKICDLLFFFCERFGYKENQEEILLVKKMLSDRISEELSRKKLKKRKCKYCGRILPWNFQYGMCTSCHDRMYGARYYLDID